MAKNQIVNYDAYVYNGSDPMSFDVIFDISSNFDRFDVMDDEYGNPVVENTVKESE